MRLRSRSTLASRNTKVDQDARVSRATVTDLGERYRVEIGDVQREFEDGAHDCVERARVAAVFIALNRKESQAAPPQAAPELPPPPPAPQRPSEPEPEPPLPADDPSIAHYGVHLFGAAGFAPEPSAMAPGGGAGVWLSAGALRFELSSGVLAATSIDLSARSGVDGSVALVRLPSTLSASYLLRAGRLQLGPTLGFAFDLLRLHGTRVPDAQTALRANAGALAAIDAHLRLSPVWLVLMRVSLSAFPRVYDLELDPAGTLGHTPRLWLGATLGIEWQFR